MDKVWIATVDTGGGALSLAGATKEDVYRAVAKEYVNQRLSQLVEDPPREDDAELGEARLHYNAGDWQESVDLYFSFFYPEETLEIEEVMVWGQHPDTLSPLQKLERKILACWRTTFSKIECIKLFRELTASSLRHAMNEVDRIVGQYDQKGA